MLKYEGKGYGAVLHDEEYPEDDIHINVRMARSCPIMILRQTDVAVALNKNDMIGLRDYLNQIIPTLK